MEAVAKRLSALFRLPRCFAIGTSKGAWTREHRILYEHELSSYLSNGVPVAVATRTPSPETLYSEYHDFAVFDIDSDDVRVSAEACVRISDGLNERSVPHLKTFSGKKGFHVFIFFEHGVRHRDLFNIQTGFMLKIGGGKGRKAQEMSIGKAYADTLISKAPGDGTIIKLPMSAHPNRTGFYDIPITDPLAVDPEHPLSMKEYVEAARILEGVERYTIKDYEGAPMSRVPSPNGRARSEPLPEFEWSIPEAGNPSIQNDIAAKISNTPCLRQAFMNATTKGGVFWERVAIATTLARSGFGAGETAAFFREHINDSNDNTDPKKLKYYVDYCYRRSDWSSCRVFQNPEGHAPICPGPCGREHPSQNLPNAITSDVRKEMLCERCKSPALRKEVKGLSSGFTQVDYICSVCGLAGDSVVIDSRARNRYRALKDAMLANPREIFCKRRLDPYVVRLRGIKTHIPIYRMFEDTKCVRCDAWKSGACDTNDDVMPMKLYTKAEIAAWKPKKRRGDWRD